MFVIAVISQKEKGVKKILEDKGYIVICPKKIKVERGREVEKVIFTSYLFLDMDSISDRDYYRIKNTVNVIGFLSNKHSLSDTEKEYIRLLGNYDSPIGKISLYFDKNNNARLLNTNSVFNSDNIVRLNKRSKTVTFRINILDDKRDITFNYIENNSGKVDN